MTTLNTFFCLILLFFTSFNGKPPKLAGRVNDWEIMSLKGSVKSVIEEQCRTTQTPQGNNKNCKVKLKTVFNSNGYKVEEQMWEFLELIERKNYVYDHHHILRKVERYDRNNSLTTTYLFEYDQNGNNVEVKIFNNDNILNTRYAYTYDKHGRKTQMQGYNLKTGGDLFIKETFTYDDLGDLVNEATEHATGNFNKKCSYKYDQTKKLIEKTIISSFESDEYSTIIRYRYDNSGSVIQETQSHNGRKSKTIIVVDETGNWLKRTTAESQETISTTERSIEYF